MTTFLDLARSVMDLLHGYVQVKNKIVYLGGDINNSTTSLLLGSTAMAQALHEGQILQLSTEAGIASELVRVVSVDVGTFTAQVRRGVMGSTAQAWTAATAIIQVEPEYP